jgi:hypothetical protein
LLLFLLVVNDVLEPCFARNMKGCYRHTQLLLVEAVVAYGANHPFVNMVRDPRYRLFADWSRPMLQVRGWGQSYLREILNSHAKNSR